MALRWMEASSSLWPPDRKQMPGSTQKAAFYLCFEIAENLNLLTSINLVSRGKSFLMETHQARRRGRCASER